MVQQPCILFCSDGRSISKVGGGGAGAKNNDQIFFAFDSNLAGLHAVTCPIYVGFRPTVLALHSFCTTIKFLMSLSLFSIVTSKI